MSPQADDATVVLDRELEGVRATILPAHASAARFAVGRPTKRTNDSASADTNGTRLIRKEFAPPASIVD